MSSLPALPAFLAAPLPAPPRSPAKRRSKPGPAKGTKYKPRHPKVEQADGSSTADQIVPAPSSLTPNQASSTAPATSSASPIDQLQPPAPAPIGGEGVKLQAGQNNLDNSAPIGQILQSDVTVRLGTSSDVLWQPSANGGDGGDEAGYCQAHSAGWPKIQVGVVCGYGRNKHYVSVEVGEGKVAKVATAGMRLVMNERVGVRLMWVSGDGRDAEYEVIRRFEQPAEEQPKVAEPIGFKGQSVPRPDREVIEPVADSDLVSGLEEAVALPTAAEQATEGAEDYLEKARRQAYEWASRG